MVPFDNYPGGGQKPIGKCSGANCRHEYGLKLQRLTKQTECAYCGLSLVDTYAHWLLMSIDHVIPTRTGISLGVDRAYLEDYCNTVLCCSACNGFGNRYKLHEAEVVPSNFGAFTKLRDRIFTERKTLILDCQRREREFFDSRPWEDQATRNEQISEVNGFEGTSFLHGVQQRQISLKPSLYSADACEPGTYGDNPQPIPIYLRNDCEGENLHASIRAEAIEYFRSRRIPWHSVGHLTSSQSCCVNLVFPFMHQPELLKGVLQELGYPVEEVLPFELDELSQLQNAGWRLELEGEPPEECPPHHIAFEWIGAKNYLKELWGRNVCGDTTRGRGQGFSSVDFAVRFRRSDGRIQIVMAEWKYTESYSEDISKQTSASGTDRLERIYRQSLELDDSQIRLPSGVKFEDLFFDPFDQMMRHQLLSSAMEREHEMGADLVSYLHIAPRANKELVERITSPMLRQLGKTIYAVWHQLVDPDRFQHCFLEDFVKAAVGHAPDDDWADFVTKRYDGLTSTGAASEAGK